MKSDKLEGLVEQLYSAAVEPALWRGTLQAVADALGADGAAVFASPALLHIFGHCSERVDDLVEWAVRQGPSLHNPRPERALKRGKPGQALTESDLFSDWELKHLPFNVGMVEEVGLRWDAGGNIGNVGGQPLLMTIQREANKERFQRQELEALEALFPHMHRAASIAMLLAQSRAQGMLEAFSASAASAPAAAACRATSSTACDRRSSC